MTTYTELLPATKSEKHAVLTWEAATDNAMSHEAGTLTISGKRSHCSYRVEEFPCDHGRGFMLFKLLPGSDKTEEQYAVFCGNGQGQCECKGFAAVGNCKHVASICELVRAKQL
jgi:hypothetical protein